MESVYTELAPFPVGPYSQAVKAGGFLFCSGQIAIDPSTNVVHREAPVGVQADMCLKNLKAVVEAAGSSMDKIVKVNISILDMNDFNELNEVYTEYFGESKPARACVAVKQLPKDVSVEIEAIAIL